MKNAISYAAITAAMVVTMCVAAPAIEHAKQVAANWFAPPPPAPDMFRVDLPSVSIEYTRP